MKWAKSTIRLIASASAIWLLWLELDQYPNEWRLKLAGDLITPVLLGEQRDGEAPARVQAAVKLAHHVRTQTQKSNEISDPRAVLLEGMGLIMLGQGRNAQALFERQIKKAERPELMLNLGRAQASLGNEASAQQAFLRAAWSSEHAVETLPKAMREAIRAEVSKRGVELVKGNPFAVPTHPRREFDSQ